MHTPGPWTIIEREGTGLFIEAKVDIGKDDMSDGILQSIYDIHLRPELYVGEDGSVTMRLCYKSWRQFPSTNFREMQKSNARLIAAAPVMLHALETIMLDTESLQIREVAGYAIRQAKER